jgi:hypothetical protein
VIIRFDAAGKPIVSVGAPAAAAAAPVVDEVNGGEVLMHACQVVGVAASTAGVDLMCSSIRHRLNGRDANFS